MLVKLNKEELEFLINVCKDCINVYTKDVNELKEFNPNMSSVKHLTKLIDNCNNMITKLNTYLSHA